VPKTSRPRAKERNLLDVKKQETANGKMDYQKKKRSIRTLCVEDRAAVVSTKDGGGPLWRQSRQTSSGRTKQVLRKTENGWGETGRERSQGTLGEATCQV